MTGVDLQALRDSLAQLRQLSAKIRQLMDQGSDPNVRAAAYRWYVKLDDIEAGIKAWSKQDP
jgi:hypothetical protein